VEENRVDGLLARLRQKECDLAGCLKDIDSFTLDELLQLAEELRAQDEDRIQRRRYSAGG